MPILFNESNSNSLLYVMKREVAQTKLTKRGGWVFYAITCYFNPQMAKELVADIQQILGSQLMGVHILIDIDEWIKQCIDSNDFVNQISELTNLPNSNISFTPISYKSKLLHAKSYALINSDNILKTNTVNGFAIVTSGNLTNSGFKDNIEIGHIIRDLNSLNEFVCIFNYLKDNYFVSKDKEAEQREFQLAAQFLSKGNFYHIWHPSFDLIFRLTLSPEERKRLYKLANNEETRNKLEDFAIKEIKTITEDPINIQSIFEIYPRPIPKELWGMYSIDTLLGQWVPFEISELIDEELEESMKIFKPIFQEIGSLQKLKEYSQSLEDYVNRKLKEKVIDFDTSNLSAVEAWNKRTKRFFTDQNILKSFICKYEKINFSTINMEHDLIIAIYQRIKDFYGESVNHIGLGKKIAEFNNYTNSFRDAKNDKNHLDEIFDRLAEQAKNMLQKNRLGELYDLMHGNEEAMKRGESFISLKITKINNIVEYERLEGIFINFEKKEDISQSMLIYKIKDNEEKISVDNLKSFQKRSYKNSRKKISNYLKHRILLNDMYVKNC